MSETRRWLAKDGADLDIKFFIKLLKTASTAGLSSHGLSMWNRSAQFVKGYEETYWSIRLSRDEDYERLLQSSAPADCNSRRTKASALCRDMLSTCMSKQAAFDQAQHGKLRVNPVSKHAMHAVNR